MASLPQGVKASAAPCKNSAPIGPAHGSILWPWLVVAAVFVVTAIQLRLQGRLWWCRCGGYQLWWGDTKSSHNSQHLLDPYSFTHVLHGLLFYGACGWLFPRLPRAWRLALAVAIEAGWEVVENTDFVINRYRSATMSLDYFGDTVANSLGDIASCVIGFILAPKLGVRGSTALFLLTEVILLLWIKDNLSLNVVMLIHPIEAVKAWQMAH